MAKKRVYVVVRGREPGVYAAWDGAQGAARQVHGFPGALYRGFARRDDARTWLDSLDEQQLPPELERALRSALDAPEAAGGERPVDEAGEDEAVIAYTDGAAIGNPGPGGYGVVLRFGDRRKELSGGYRMTTNNRMELMACIAALEALKWPCTVLLYSDSRYVVDGMRQGWAKRWRKRGWRRANGDPAENVDLWDRLLTASERHEVAFRWVKGHAGHPDNERADRLATEAARRQDLPPDRAYEAGETQSLNPRLL